MSTRIQQLMQLFERTGHLYVGGIMNPAWDRIGERPSAQQALELFLGQYAYQRAGASPDYAPAASEAIRTSGTDLSPEHIWATFTDLVGGATNPLRNPLFPERPGRCRCLLCVFGSAGNLRNLITTARDALAAGQVENMHRDLKSVRGIGPKIASFFLRDVAMRYGLELEPVEDRRLLQPVDLWIRRFALTLDDRLPSTVAAIGQWMVDNARSPELANAGMWYFGARIEPRKFIYKQALDDPGFARALVESYVTRLKGAVKAWELNQ